ncbi:hypothetical protein DM02DRAFT_607992 [Periconia macrospinosa]|uniref:C2H2-type domain-containing protein n=1 Tax=Periconia macrospinosa TaxID=97972 RepID=A0A2V1EGF5_9PLEO|nr:hypothetical protein DM02DRAFT_607992 [Periconia macrospinosa]
MADKAIPRGYWKKPMDFTLLKNFQGELHVLFTRHVRQLSPTIPNTSFSQYSNLPAEIRLRVVRSCDKATLFQLMHTSRETRAEAKRLFFSDPGAWYCVHSDWLRSGGHPDHTLDDMNFLACIERLCIEDGWLLETPTDDRIRKFWNVVRSLFPRVKHILLSEHNRRLPDEGLPEAYKKIAKMCPLNIHISSSLLVAEESIRGRLKRKTWRRSSAINDTQEWTECADHEGQLVNPPYREFRGRVGEFDKGGAMLKEISDQESAIRMHRMAAIEKFHFEGSPKPFSCPAPDCDAWFEHPEEYTTHAIKTRHDKTAELPEPFKPVFTENRERLNRLWERYRGIDNSFREWYGEWGSEQRRDAEKEVLYELEHDPLYAQDQTVTEHRILEGIRRYIDGDC